MTASGVFLMDENEAPRTPTPTMPASSINARNTVVLTPNDTWSTVGKRSHGTARIASAIP